MGKTLRRTAGAKPAPLWLGAAVLFVSACEGVNLGTDQLQKNLTPRQEQACRDAARQAVAQQNISEDRIRRVHYQRIVSNSHGTSSRITGFEAWIYPKEGTGALVFVLNEACQVTGSWTHGSPTF